MGSRHIISAANRRTLTTTRSVNFKFKLTDEMSEEFERQQQEKLAAQKLPQLAESTLASSLLMGRVSDVRYKQVVKIGVPKHRLNPMLLLYVRETDEVQVYDENNLCKPGDWVLIRKWPESTDKAVTHKVEKVVHEHGNYVDPLSGRRAFGLYYDDDLEKLEQIKLDCDAEVPQRK